MNFTPVKRLLADTLHGGLLKVLTLLGRVAFLILVVPTLLDGELATYVFINSSALIISTVATLALKEELPRHIGGDLEKASQYYYWYFVLSIPMVVVLGATFYFPSVTAAIVLFSSVLSGGRYISGIIRGLDVALYERLQNFPWLLFILVVLLFGQNSAIDLIVAMSACMIAIQWYALIRVGAINYLKKHVAHIAFKDLVKLGLSHGVLKLGSNLLLLGFVRGMVLWPVWLMYEMDLDEIAFAIAVGEIISQFGIIPVNRAYSRWCKTLPVHRADWHNAVSSSLAWGAILFVTGLAGLAAASFFGWLPPQVENIWILIQAIALYSLMPSLRLLRYLVWSRGILGIWVVVISLVMFIAQAIIVTAVPQNIWFIVSAGVVLSASVVLALRSKQEFCDLA